MTGSSGLTEETKHQICGEISECSQHEPGIEYLLRRFYCVAAWLQKQDSQVYMAIHT